MKGAIAKAQELAAQTPNSFIPGQFTNPANPSAHRATTGPEIWNDTDGTVDIFVAGVGTGGTLTGVGEYLKSQNPQRQGRGGRARRLPGPVKGVAGAHKIQGIGAGFVPDTLNTKVYDEIITVENEDAFATGRELARKEGLLVGISSGAAVWAAAQLAKRPRIRASASSSCCPTPATATFPPRCSQTDPTLPFLTQISSARSAREAYHAARSCSGSPPHSLARSSP